MSRSFLRQDAQIRNSVLYADNLGVGSGLETQTNVEGDLNAVRSQMRRALVADGAGNWYQDINVPSTFETGAKRGITNLNTDLHELERKRVLVASANIVDVLVTAAQNWQVLTLGQLPNNTNKAVGVVATRGTVGAFHTGTFGTHALDLVSGASALAPKNLCEVTDATTHDPILSSGRVIYALLQFESVTDNIAMTGTTPNRAQVSFVRINTASTALEAVPAGDIATKTVHISYVERKALDDLNEQDFLRGAVTDVPGATTVTRQEAYNNQGTTPVEVATDSDLDLNAAGVFWRIRDLANASLMKITEGSTGGTTTFEIGADVDVLNINSIANTFAKGSIFDSTGVPIQVGKTAITTTGTIESTGSNDLRLMGAGELFLDDGNQAGSTWLQTKGIKLSDTMGEWDLFETTFGGEVSLLNAITQAKTASGRVKGVAVVTAATVAANANVSGTTGTPNLDATLPSYVGKTFLTDVDVFLNGQLLRNDSSTSGANDHDVYPGTTAANGDLKFEFGLHGSPGNPDVITMIVW